MSGLIALDSSPLTIGPCDVRLRAALPRWADDFIDVALVKRTASLTTVATIVTVPAVELADKKHGLPSKKQNFFLPYFLITSELRSLALAFPKEFYDLMLKPKRGGSSRGHCHQTQKTRALTRHHLSAPYLRAPHATPPSSIIRMLRIRRFTGSEDLKHPKRCHSTMKLSSDAPRQSQAMLPTKMTYDTNPSKKQSF